MSAQNGAQRCAYMKPRIRFPFFDEKKYIFVLRPTANRRTVYWPRLSIIRPNHKRNYDRISTKFDAGKCYQSFSVNSTPYYNLTTTETLHEHVPVSMCAPRV